MAAVVEAGLHRCNIKHMPKTYAYKTAFLFPSYPLLDTGGGYGRKKCVLCVLWCFTLFDCLFFLSNPYSKGVENSTNLVSHLETVADSFGWT